MCAYVYLSLLCPQLRRPHAEILLGSKDLSADIKPIFIGQNNLSGMRFTCTSYQPTMPLLDFFPPAVFLLYSFTTVLCIPSTSAENRQTTAMATARISKVLLIMLAMISTMR